MRRDLEAAGMESVAPGSPADVVVVNTCTVTRRADQESRQLIRRIAREAPGARIVVTGCYAQRAPEEIRTIPGVTAVLGIAERERIAEHLGREAGAVAVGSGREKRPFTVSSPLHFGRTRALLKVQDGCDSFCSYCIVPYVRGRSRSHSIAEALEQARRLLEVGFSEIVITGADLGDYGSDLGEKGLLARLVRSLLALGSSHRVRLSSIEPNKLDPEIVDMIGAEPRLCRHLHLPLQSGSDSVLRAMKRPYRASEYAALITRIGARGPVGVGTDVIVGSPGEGEQEFEETESFLRDIPVTYLHVFRYSPRPGTAAARQDSAPDAATARSRSNRLRELGVEKRGTFLESLVGSRLVVLPESTPEGAPLFARSDLYAPVRLPGARPWRGLAEVAITGVDGDHLIGVPMDLRSAGAPGPPSNSAACG